MIELVVRGYCEHCTFRDLELFDGIYPVVACTHSGVCRYIDDKERETGKRIDNAVCGDKTAQNAK